MKRKGQSSIELMALVGAAIFLMLVFTVVMVFYLNISTQQSLALSARDLALTLKSEIDLASTVEDKYERTIGLPAVIDDKPYEVFIGTGEASKREVVIKLGNEEFSEIFATDIASGIQLSSVQPKGDIKITKGINNPGEVIVSIQ